jgi:hypothetical protein
MNEQLERYLKTKNNLMVVFYIGAIVTAVFFKL